MMKYELKRGKSKLTVLHYTKTSSISLERPGDTLVPFQAVDIYLDAIDFRDLARELNRRADILDSLEKLNGR